MNPTKNLAYSKSLVAFSHTPARIRNRAEVRDGRQMLGHYNSILKVKQNFMELNAHSVIEKHIKEICFFFHRNGIDLYYQWGSG